MPADLYSHALRPPSASFAPRWASLLVGVALPALLLASAASAQLTGPAFRNLDSNGVDLTQGDYVLNFVEGSIGSGIDQLTLVRTNTSGRGSQWDNILNDITDTTVSPPGMTGAAQLASVKDSMARPWYSWASV